MKNHSSIPRIPQKQVMLIYLYSSQQKDNFFRSLCITVLT